jgi:alpha-1,2-mannosyltransferase
VTTRSRWLAAGAGLAIVSVAVYLALYLGQPGRYDLQWDATIYRDAGAAALHHRGDLYDRMFGTPPNDYLYTPFAALVFGAFSPLPFTVWKVILVAANIGCVLAAALGAVRLAGLSRGWRRLGIGLTIAAVGMWLEPVNRTFSWGQINLMLLVLVMLDLVYGNGRRWQGVGIGLAAAVKLTPLIFVPYLWFTGRRRAAIVSLVTFAGSVVIGFVLLPHDSAGYWGGKMFRKDGTQVIVNQSLYGALQRLAGGAGWYQSAWLLTAAVVGVGGLAVSIVAARRGNPLLGLVACGVTGLLVSPISWNHHWVFVLPALALLVPGPAATSWPRRLATRLALGLPLVVLFLVYPTRFSAPSGHWNPAAQLKLGGLLGIVPHDGTLEYHWHGWQLVLGNMYVILGLLFLGAVAVSQLWGARAADLGDARRRDMSVAEVLG